jgi:hypothetical protein
MLGGSSNLFNAHIVKIIKQLDARRILELGCGTGKFSNLISNPNIDITAVQKLFNPGDEQLLHQAGYKKIIDMDILDYFRVGFDEQYDAVVILDVIEHFLLGDALSILTFALYRANWVLVAWPSKHPQMGEIHAFDRHRCSLEIKDLTSHFDVVFYSQTGFAQVHFLHRYHLVLMRGYMNPQTALPL